MNKSLIIAAIFISVASLWLLSGQFSEHDTDIDSADIPDIEEILTVRAMVSSAQAYVRQLKIRGETEADSRVELRSEIDSRVVELNIEKGDSVEKGQVLIRLATDDRAAALTEAKALVEQRNLEFQAAKQLNQKGFRAETATAQAKAALESAIAGQKRAEVALNNTRIVAPFAGIIEELPAEIGAFMQKGTHIATIVDHDPILIVANVSEREINKVSLGSPAAARLPDGTQITGTITFVSESATEETRTFRVEMEALNTGGTIRDGMTSELLLPLGEVQAHFLTPAILTLNDEGQLGIRVVNTEDIVEFRVLNVIGNDPKGIWVTGIDPTDRVIIVGQEFVIPGQKVLVDLVEEKAS